MGEEETNKEILAEPDAVKRASLKIVFSSA
jgi:hypothetical protein